MELQQLKYFVTVAREEHITKAAQRLNIAQPALSQSIRRLEEELGVRLFDREGRGIRLNEVGKELLRDAEPVLKTLDEIPAKLRARAGMSGNTIKLNVLSASRLTTDIIIAYKEQNPQVFFQISQDPKGEDWDMRISTTFAADPSADSKGNNIILEEEIFLAVPVDFRYADREEISLKEVEDEPFITFMGSKPYRVLFDGFCAMAKIEPNIVFESDNPATVRDLIGAGMGVAFWPDFSWGRLKSDKVKLLHISHPHCKRDLIVTRNPKHDLTEIQKDFYRFVLNYIKTFSR